MCLDELVCKVTHLKNDQFKRVDIIYYLTVIFHEVVKFCHEYMVCNEKNGKENRLYPHGNLLPYENTGTDIASFLEII